MGTGRFCVVCWIALIGCSGREPARPGPGTDAGRTDAGPVAPDGGSELQDAGPPRMDAAVEPDAGPTADAGSSLLCLPRPPGEQPFRPPPGCEGVLAESHYCALLEGGMIRFLGLDTGALCDGPRSLDAAAYGNASLGWAGNYLYVCVGSAEGRLVRIDLDDGSSVDLGGSCSSVTTYGGGLLVMPELGRGGLVGYADEGRAVDRTPDARFDFSYLASRLSAHEDRALLAWHSTPEVTLAELIPGAATARTITLGGFDDWVHGLDLLDDGTFVIITRGAAGAGGNRVLFFDDTGRMTRMLAPPGLGMVNGIACHSGPPPAPIRFGTPTRPVGPPPGGFTTCAALDTYAATLDNAHGPSMSNPTCGGEGSPSNYLSYCDQLDPAMPRELHVIGVYEAPGHDVVGPIDVTVHARPLPVVLALASYEAAEWRLTLDPGVTLERIVVGDYPSDGMDSRVVGAPAGVPIDRLGSPCGYAYGWEAIYNTGGGDYRALVAQIRAQVDTVETTFQGCYVGGSFEVPFR